MMALIGAIIALWLVAIAILLWVGHRLELHTHARDYLARDREADRLRGKVKCSHVHDGEVTNVIA